MANIYNTNYLSFVKDKEIRIVNYVDCQTCIQEFDPTCGLCNYTWFL